MDRQERRDHIQTLEEELLRDYRLSRRHIEALESLDQSTSFDLDVATDIRPELIDQRTQYGREHLRFWQSLYQAFENEPQFITLTRYVMGTDPLYAFGNVQPTPIIQQAYVRIFEHITEDKVAFIKSSASDSYIGISSPHLLLSYHKDKPLTIEHEEFATLFKADRTNANHRDPFAIPELLLTPVVSAGDTPTILGKELSSIHAPLLQMQLPTWILEYDESHK